MALSKQKPVQHAPTPPSPPRFSAKSADFCAQLEGAQEQAIATAFAYLLRGVGEYVPTPRLRGVDVVSVVCTRAFGCVQVDEHSARVAFMEQWEDHRQRHELIRSVGVQSAMSTDKAAVFVKWFEHLKSRAANHCSSADYRVTFTGTAGRWSAFFTLGCTSFTDGASVDPLPGQSSSSLRLSSEAADDDFSEDDEFL